MAKGSMDLKFVNQMDVIARINGMRADSEKVIQSTMKDIAGRAPGWVSQEVTKVYNIKKAEVKGNGKQGSIGSIKIAGVTVDSYVLTYKGRPLTFTHFGQTPKAPRRPGYTISAQIFKGQKVEVHGKSGNSGRPFLMSNGSTAYLATQRKTDGRFPVEVLRSLSIPQMIENKDVNAAIYERIGAEGIKRLNHHFDRYMKKKK